MPAEPWEKEATRLEKLAKPVIVVAKQEQLDLHFNMYPAVWATLPTGDYGLRGMSGETIYDLKGNIIGHQPEWYIFERKAKDTPYVVLDRVQREVDRMMNFRWRAFIVEMWECQVEGGDYRSKILPGQIIGMLNSYRARNVHIIWAGSAQGAANLVEDITRHWVRRLCRMLAMEKFNATDATCVRAALSLE